MKFIPGRRKSTLGNIKLSEVPRQRILTVLSLEGKPTLEVDANITAAEARQLVAHTFGYNGIGVPHSWIVQ